MLDRFFGANVTLIESVVEGVLAEFISEGVLHPLEIDNWEGNLIEIVLQFEEIFLAGE